jgi:hypothetical protein
MSDNLNPLSKHFRQPVIHLKLPSGGRYWPAGSLELPATGQVPVYPMTTKNEIILRTPDALMNGSAITSIIQDCIPCINDAWSMPSIDVDACLLAIRVASYGEKMDISFGCPACKHVDDAEINLLESLDRLARGVQYTPFYITDGLQVQLKPHTWRDVNQYNITEYENNRIAAQLVAASDDVRAANIDSVTDRIVDLSITMLVKSTEFILTPEGEKVSNPQFLTEFYNNCSSKVSSAIEQYLLNFTNDVKIQPFACECSECGHQFKTQIEFEYSSFFAKGS